MELKVWVEGIKRVVCGVTDSTTCQDIVIALAHAMGRTGRFTLIEKWRDNERPLSPSEYPLQVLQKWGEFANEVQLCLYESHGLKQLPQETEKEVQRTRDRFTHNFTPPPKPPESVVKRSLTFSGARQSVNEQNFKQNRLLRGHVNHVIPHKTMVPEKVTSDGNSWSSSSSLSSQNSTVLPPQVKSSSAQTHLRDRNLQSPSYQHRPPPYPASSQHPGHHSAPHQHSSHNSSQNVQISQNHPGKQSPGVSILNVIQNRASAFQPVRPRHNSHENEINTRLPDMDIPMYSADVAPKSSHKPEVEEYDLDSNFPDVVKETGREFLIEEYHVPGKSADHRHRNHVQESKEEKERMELIRLVSKQQERIKMQDSQINLADTEIVSREQSQKEVDAELQRISAAILQLGGKHADLGKDLVDLEGGRWIEDIEKEKQSEKAIKTEIAALQTRLTQCESSLHQFQVKVKLCSDQLEKEKEVIESDEKRRKEEEMKIKKDISQVQRDFSERSKEGETLSKTASELETELKEVEEALEKKMEELAELDNSLKEENMRIFKGQADPETSKQHELSGEAVLKVLESGIKSPVTKRRSKDVPSPLTILVTSKNPNGVWV